MLLLREGPHTSNERQYMNGQKIAGILLVVGLCGCASPHGGGGGGGNSPCGNQLDTVTTTHQGGTATSVSYKVDGQGRIKTLTTPTATTTYTYSGSTKVTQTPSTGTAIVYTLDSNGNAISDSRNVTYTYTGNQLTLISYPAGSVGSNPAFTVQNTYDGSGNISVQKRTGWNDITFTFEYTTIPYYDDGIHFMGAKLVNWPATMTESDGTFIKYDYVTDSCGRVQQRTATTSVNGSVQRTDVSTWTYQ